jgi:hypothetical protein
MKLTILIDDPETRAIWETAQRAKAEVARWPAWKRGEQDDHPAAESPPDPSGADRDGDGSR